MPQILIRLIATFGIKRLLYALAIASIFSSGVYLGHSYTKKYYKQKEIAALVERLEHNKKVITYQTEYVTKQLEKEKELEAQIEELQDAADNSPTANRPSLSIDSVQRLNKIR